MTILGNREFNFFRVSQPWWPTMFLELQAPPHQKIYGYSTDNDVHIYALMTQHPSQLQ